MISLPRRHLIMGLSSLPLLAACRPRHEGPWASDVAQVESTPLASRRFPSATRQVQDALAGSTGAVCIAGGRYSMGGQTSRSHAMQLDMAGYDALLWIDPHKRVARVQSGMRWRTLQDHLDPLGLSVKVMQSFSNFTVGGSVSVNCHGRYIGHGAIASTVRAIQLVTADGQVLELDRTHNQQVFAAVIGGYGGLGVITEVELDLSDNVRMSRTAQRVPLEDYPQWFADTVLGNPLSVMHNADLLPPHFNEPLSITWNKTHDPLTDHARLTPVGARYSKQQNLIWSATELPAGGQMRDHFLTGRILSEPRVVWRNREASLDVASLEPRTRLMSTYLLQEYFIPVAGFAEFAKAMRRVLSKFDPEVLNVSIRHAPQDPLSLLSWSPQDVFCFVLYHKQRNFPWCDDSARIWTRELVAAALDAGGRHYLPYRLHASRAQVRKAYRGMNQWMEIKHQLDPQLRFRNHMLDAYFL
jgi:FAD/FMN-containing dehydrogenase